MYGARLSLTWRCIGSLSMSFIQGCFICYLKLVLELKPLLFSFKTELCWFHENIWEQMLCLILITQLCLMSWCQRKKSLWWLELNFSVFVVCECELVLLSDSSVFPYVSLNILVHLCLCVFKRLVGFFYLLYF